MFRYIVSLQKKSPEARKKIAFVVAVAVTGIIVIVWFPTLQMRFSSNDSTSQNDETSSPFTLIKKQVQSLGESFYSKFDYKARENGLQE